MSDKDPKQQVDGNQFDKCAWRATRWGAISAAGVLLWMLALVVLDVPADLDQWRLIGGSALAAFAVHLLMRA